LDETAVGAVGGVLVTTLGVSTTTACGVADGTAVGVGTADPLHAIDAATINSPNTISALRACGILWLPGCDCIETTSGMRGHFCR
jgi:hypothetical protein